MSCEKVLHGKVALVTGAGRSLGKGMTLALAEARADVAGACRTECDLDDLVREVEALGSRGLAVPTDVSRLDQIPEMVQRVVSEFGGLDILVTAAGTIVRGPTLEMTEEEYDLVMNTNLKSVMFCCNEAAKAMIKRGGGKIINVASLSCMIGLPGRITYAMSKAGVAQMMKSMAREWAQYGINVNAVGPGYFKTEITKPLFEDKEFVARLMERIPLGRPGLPEDLGGAVVFLASPASDYVTGQILWVDGGWLAS